MKNYPLRGGEALAKAVERAYREGGGDYTMEPLCLVSDEGVPVGLVKPGDAVIFCCRRGEREIELTDAFTDPAFAGFSRPALEPLDFVILTMYNEKYTYLPIAFAPSKVGETLAETVSQAGKRQLHLAESEKFAHVTFFFNGGNQQPFPGEEDARIPSPKGVAFDTVPELSLAQVADRLCAGIDEGVDFIVTNFANGDVIGHTANDAAKLACAEIVDGHLGRVLSRARQAGYTTLITADHGNLERARTETGKPDVAHTTNQVACIAVTAGAAAPAAKGGALRDVAPTVLAAMGLPQPGAMDGQPLFSFSGPPRKVLLLILDGWGIGRADDTNPIYLSSTPVWDDLLRTCPTVLIEASGSFVGLGEGKAGNSEAGHLNLGAGRVVPQDDVRLDAAMADGTFTQNPIFLQAARNAKARGGALHLLALLTKKSSHGSIDYPLALLDLAKAQGLDEVYVHIIFDGRSTEPGSAPALLRELGATMAAKGIGQIVSGVGRGIALDRDQNWAKIQKTYDSLVSGAGRTYTE
ncbi:MAG: phosphoglycerate mutase (2,3-diphosphoglycerate-independent) [Peptococcaceae bacterium]|jgi:2,3-bisphosphoglycerate-independent phosphoglycerate mutase|nr:phosphoglycerate mutase (2,3-diphosphoglycerate-independent) [Peptococcaceae bacterium]